MCVAHVCHRWRETALNHPRLWSHIDFTKLIPAAMAEILARAKMMPLHLEADVIKLSVAQYEAFGSQLEEHISHTRYLSISGCLQTTLDRLVSSAPTLEFLSLSHKSRKSAMPQVAITVNLFNCTAPRLTSLELENCVSVGNRLSSGAYEPSRYIISPQRQGLSWKIVGRLERYAPTRNPYPSIRNPTGSTGSQAYITFAPRYISLPRQIPYFRFRER
ncbi:hypothetical protein BJV77DRAFT_1153874, partial [Russula vinacea]